MFRLLPWSLAALGLLAACSDYNFTSDKDEADNDDDEDSTVVDTADTADLPTDECLEPDLSTGTVSIDESCEVEATVGSFSPIQEWSDTSMGDSYVTPVVGHLTDDDGDGVYGSEGDVPDIVAVSEAGTVYVYSGDGSGIHWTWAGAGSAPATAAIGDLDGDGAPEVVTGGGYGFTALRGSTGTIYWTSPSNASLGNVGMCGGVAIHDLDADGDPEVIQGNLIINGQTGALRGKGAQGIGAFGGFYSMGVAADIDQDGDMEVVVGNALYDADGNTIWSNGQQDGFVAVGNFDSDPYGEIVVTENGRMRLQDDDGSVLWSGSYTTSRIGPPTVADFDGDGEPEIGVAGMNAYIVVEGDGSLLWQMPTQDASSGVTGSAVFDFEGDGAAEAVYADETSVWVFDGATGTVKMQYTNHSSATCTEYPAIADVDNDGQAEIVFVSDVYTKSFTGITVLGDADGSWMPGTQSWNQHAYWITNVDDVGANVPQNADTNWLSYNNFRSGDLASGNGGVYADAVPEIVEICTEECDEGRLRAVVRVGNSGMTEMPAGVPLQLYGDYGGEQVLLAERATTEAVAPGGTTSGMVFDLAPEYVESTLTVIVNGDTDNALFVECNEDNNETSSGDVCGG